MKLEYIIPTWTAPTNVMAVTTTRMGGYSKNVYESLNLGANVKDKQINVVQNRQLLKNDLQLVHEPIWMNQTHGSNVLELQSELPEGVTADAAFTKETNIVCAALTADCLPVLFCNQTGEYVAVAHAGWRGLINGVIENTLQKIPVDTHEIFCWLGPAIGPDKFEVGPEVFEQFLAKNPKHENAFKNHKHSKYLANIYQLAKNILIDQGVVNYFGGEYCTYSNRDKFYSYRRDGETGRMATLIWKSFSK